MLKKGELSNIIKDALLDLPDISDKPNEDKLFSLFEKEVENDGDGNLIFTFTETHGSHKETDKYKITIELLEEPKQKEETPIQTDQNQYHMKSYLNTLDEKDRTCDFFCWIRTWDDVEKLTVVDVGLSTFSGIMYYGVEHYWRYLIDIEQRSVFTSSCHGGAYFGLKYKQIDIIKTFPSLLEFIIDHINEIAKAGDDYYRCRISRIDGSVIEKDEKELSPIK